jgi:gamma-glutamylcyclotransferase (GGCT)/AIG2-like uncharacterized protein YtfP
MEDRLFVYGTLMSGERAFALFAAASLRSVAARLHNARLHNVDGYPIAVLGKGTVSGEVHWLDPAQLPSLLQQLDHYEGDEYVRTICSVHLATGEQCEAWVYLGDPTAAERLPLIRGGDWRQRA